MVDTLKGHFAPVTSVAVYAEGRRAISASSDDTLRVWDLEGRHLVRTLEGHSSWVQGVAVYKDGHRAVSASLDKTLKVWDLQTYKEVASFTCDADARCCAFVDAGRMVGGDELGRLHWLELVE
jgi:WD40 repeat protein